MPTLKEYNRCGEELENILGLSTSPIAVKMLESEADIPKGAVRPKKDRGYHLAQCQAFALSRRDRIAVAMLKEDNWCPGAVISYGLIPRPDDPAHRAQNTGECFEYGKYIGILTAPLKKATFEPDAVIIYCDTNQLRIILLSLKMEERQLVKSNFFPFSCSNSIVPVMLHGEYWINLPDPGEYARALTIPGEMMFSVPREKLPALVENLCDFDRNESGFAHEQMMMRPDFPQPDLYKHVFESWGMDHE
ncbi:MAG: DUF169 domain-containing protein [Dehalococcoidales bacterium]|nr:DUF169 domain-containing protein [Dehalococcoidales bacterium]